MIKVVYLNINTQKNTYQPSHISTLLIIPHLSHQWREGTEMCSLIS